jgi:hypothetical protein
MPIAVLQNISLNWEWPQIQEQQRGILLLALASVNLRILRPSTVVRLPRILSRTSQG